jgi:DNA-binding transcriptional ArsR family regulator
VQGGSEGRERILRLLRERGPVTLYGIARALGMPYSSVQWHVFALEREGLVRTVRVGWRRYACLDGRPPDVTLGDLLAEIRRHARGLEGLPAAEALRLLERRAPHVAEALAHLLSLVSGRPGA